MATIATGIDKNLTKLEDQLKAWGTQFSEATSKAGKDVSDESRKQFAELKAKFAAAQAKLDEAKAGGGDKWETLKGGVEMVWQDLETTFKKLIH
ncbi:MAG: coiled coil domain-containing protein [Myxococcales bacterium]|jgi:hypothetical protein|nr:coiled coil domain-containing protein [Myxococcales bacterium]MBK7197847.1 coiled coil domain-containing protein [Myxococcales bacterium]MBP6846307.1 hypothetical protein [Kofleriaceae bacterium]